MPTTYPPCHLLRELRNDQRRYSITLIAQPVVWRRYSVDCSARRTAG